MDPLFLNDGDIASLVEIVDVPFTKPAGDEEPVVGSNHFRSRKAVAERSIAMAARPIPNMVYMQVGKSPWGGLFTLCWWI